MPEILFFKQKTAYEMLRSLVGSEMCIRDRLDVALPVAHLEPAGRNFFRVVHGLAVLLRDLLGVCLLYTSDAATIYPV